MKIVHAGEIAVGVYNSDGELFAIEDRCSHDDGPLCRGRLRAGRRRRHLPAARRAFDVRTGKALTLPAYLPVDTFPVGSRTGWSRSRHLCSTRVQRGATRAERDALPRGQRADQAGERDVAFRRLRLTFVCECGDPECTIPVSLSLAEYEEVRADPTRFVVIPGHIDPYVEVRRRPRTTASPSSRRTSLTPRGSS